MACSDNSKVRSIDATVLGTIRDIRLRARHREGSDPTMYIDKVISQKRGYHELIRSLCEARGVPYEHLVDLFDRQLENIRREVGSEPDLVDLTSTSPLPPALDFPDTSSEHY